VVWGGGGVGCRWWCVHHRRQKEAVSTEDEDVGKDRLERRVRGRRLCMKFSAHVGKSYKNEVQGMPAMVLVRKVAAACNATAMSREVVEEE